MNITLELKLKFNSFINLMDVTDCTVDSMHYVP